jgi:hypothetical protein
VNIVFSWRLRRCVISDARRGRRAAQFPQAGALPARMSRCCLRSS